MTIDELQREVQNTIAEYDYLMKNVIDPLWGDAELHGFRSVLYGLLMRYGSFVDAASIYYYGDIQQSKRMFKLLTEELNYSRIPSLIVVKTWRHALMHQGEPTTLVDSTGGLSFRWLLHWDEKKLGEQNHMQFQDTTQGKNILNLCLERFLIDLLLLVKNMRNEITDQQVSFAASHFKKENEISVSDKIKLYSS